MSIIKNVLILSGDTEGNLGDRAILHATCSELLAIVPDIQINIISEKTPAIPGLKKIHNIKPGIRGFFPLLLAAKRADLILCGGGGLFQDDDSLIKMPYWALRILLVRLFCNYIVGYSLGVGPLSARSSQLFARLAFACMKHVSTRDKIARDTAQKLTNKPVILVPDPALLILPTNKETTEKFLASQQILEIKKPVIGVAVRRWFPAKRRLIPNKISAKFRRKDKAAIKQSERMCKLLAATLDQLVSKYDAHIVLMPTYNVSHESDDKISLEIMDCMQTDAASIIHIDTPQLYKAVASRLTLLLCGRMHPSIFAAGIGTAVVGLAYNPKFKGFFSLLGLDNYVMDVGEFIHHKKMDELVALIDKALIEQIANSDRVETLTSDFRQFNRRILGVML